MSNVRTAVALLAAASGDALATPPLLGAPVSRNWRIRHPSAIVREIPPRSVRTYKLCRFSRSAACASAADRDFLNRLTMATQQFVSRVAWFPTSCPAQTPDAPRPEPRLERYATSHSGAGRTPAHSFERTDHRGSSRSIRRTSDPSRLVFCISQRSRERPSYSDVAVLAQRFADVIRHVRSRRRECEQPAGNRYAAPVPAPGAAFCFTASRMLTMLSTCSALNNASGPRAVRSV